VNGDQPLVKFLNTEPFHGETESGMSADYYLVTAVKEQAQGAHFAAILATSGVAKVPLRHHAPVCPKAVLGQWLVVEARANGPLGHNYDCLPGALVGELVQSNKHERAAF